MNEYNIKVNFNSNSIYSGLKHLVESDYNSTKLNFTFDKTGSRVLFKLLYPDGTYYVDEIVNNALTLPAGALNQNGYYSYEISLYDEDSKLTNYATDKFFVRKELVDTDEIVEVDDRIPVLDKLITDIDTALDDLQDKVDSGYFKGEKGDKGDTGEQGAQGERGLQGEQGIQGEKGEKGDKGDKGDTGEKGQDGINGKDGKDGAIQYTAGDNISINGNVINAKIDLSDYYDKDEVNSITGLLNNLDTGDKTNLVNAINELASSSGGDCNVTPLTENADMRDLPTGFYKNTSNNQIIVTIAVVGNYTVEISVDDIFYWNNPIYYNPSSTSSPGSMLVRISRVWGIPYKPAIEMYYTDIATSGGRKGPYYAYKTTLDLTTVLNTDGTQTITGTKTFNNLPQSSVVPSSDNQLVNKKYVDDAINNKIWTGTQAEYDALETYSNDTIYFIKES